MSVGRIGSRIAVAGLTGALVLTAGCGVRTDRPESRFAVREGLNLNYFLRDGVTAGHLVLRSGLDPRLLVAFPAGNSGTGVWFDRLPSPAEWVLDEAPKSHRDNDSHGRPRHGMAFVASITAAELHPREGVLSSVRVLRDYEQDARLPAGVAAAPSISDDSITWERDRLDGAPGYRLDMRVLDGRVSRAGVITAGTDGRIKVRVEASSGEPPLSSLAGELLNGRERKLDSAIDTLGFLGYREKFLAGSWRFDTYFGRDTLISLKLLSPVLTGDAIEAGLRSVLTRLAPDGTVAHEESIGEYAILAHREQTGTLTDAPIFDYSMVDESYLLAPTLAAYLLDEPAAANRAAAFLRSTAGTPEGTAPSIGAALVRNLRLAVTSAEPFANRPGRETLIALQPGRDAGEWRDSTTGLGGGRYPYDVDVVLVPAALEATAHLLASGLLDPYLTQDDRALLTHAAGDATVWRAEAPKLFTVTIDPERARAALTTYAEHIGVPVPDATAALGPDPISFPALALTADGAPIPVLHSDAVLDLLYGTPPPANLDAEVTTMIRPFPLGLMTGVGPVVADPVFATPELRDRFTAHHYHGTVVWSWVQAAFAAGLDRQLHRPDLPNPVREHLEAARRTLWQSIDAVRDMQNSELWSWRYAENRYQPVPFGAHADDITESDAAQLWSTAYLALTPPS
ncbi:hypothetical protein [Nocardia sp. BMG111209]|uniref:hypothetical protein n=1 Tax=Nocardia sp. BMG111209 TaxID=1160137 RepID=UPI0004762E65|nr:hypothetical protein [Nocardia sp. BMG111209]